MAGAAVRIVGVSEVMQFRCYVVKEKVSERMEGGGGGGGALARVCESERVRERARECESERVRESAREANTC
jgi:hypothetical protein